MQITDLKNRSEPCFLSSHKLNLRLREDVGSRNCACKGPYETQPGGQSACIWAVDT